MLSWLKRAARELNWARRSWSTTSDREFHEDLYRVDNYDPFSWAYPGYTTIRRFADSVEPILPARGLVVDLGCGPGEITCELASRRPDLSFLGIDHSTSAVAKARTNIGRRNVANVRFECLNVEEYVPQGHVDLVTLFDSFHHLIKPSEFVSRLSPHVTRWALIEPRGSWLGTWRKDIDFDWLAQDLDKIRARVAASIKPTAPASALRATAGKPIAPSAPDAPSAPAHPTHPSHPSHPAWQSSGATRSTTFDASSMGTRSICAEPSPGSRAIRRARIATVSCASGSASCGISCIGISTSGCTNAISICTPSTGSSSRSAAAGRGRSSSRPSPLSAPTASALPASTTCDTGRIAAR